MKLADIRSSSGEGTVVAALTGEVDMSNADEILEALSDAMPNVATGLILDLSELDYLDSAGIQILFRLHAALRTRSQGLVLLVPEESVVADTFRLAGIHGLIDLAPDLESARVALDSGAPPER